MQDELILITSTKTLLPKKVTFLSTRDQDFRVLLEDTIQPTLLGS